MKASDAQRLALLETGMKVVHARGFSATGVRDIAAAAGVPQGSFTNHFRSKEAFGVLVLDRYAKRIDAIMRETLGDDTLTPADRLRVYFDRIEQNAAEAQWRHGCIVPDLAGEIGNHGEALRDRLCLALEQQTERFEAVLRMLLPEDDGAAADLAGVLLAAWHGTLLRMKVENAPAAVERFRRVLSRFLDVHF